MSLCPAQLCKVRKSTFAQRCIVQNVARNLCNQKCFGSSAARLATFLQMSRKSNLGLQPPVGNKRGQPGCACFFHSRNESISSCGTGTLRSRYAFGVQLYSGLWRIVITFFFKSTLRQVQYITSC